MSTLSIIVNFIIAILIAVILKNPLAFHGWLIGSVIGSLWVLNRKIKSLSHNQ